MTNTRTILSEVASGKELTGSDLLSLMQRDEGEAEIIELADELNRRVNQNVVTFVHNRNINYTNICQNHCLFCGFRRDIGHPESFTLTIDEILQKISETSDITEVCIQGGISPELRFVYILDMLSAIKSAYPHIHIHAFSPMEIKHFLNISGLSIDSVLSKLLTHGLGSIPGTAAEILDDNLRKIICPEKITVWQWINIIKTAHQLGIHTTATVLFGHIETPTQLAYHLEIIKDIQKETMGFTEFIPLLFVPFTTNLGRKFRISALLPLTKVRKLYALSRIYFNPILSNIQVSWPKLGYEDAIKCLSWGVNDLGGTLYEENITSSAGGIHGQEIGIQEFITGITKAGKKPRQRDTLYNLLSDNW